MQTMDTGAIIRACRNRLHWTRARLSEKAGVPVGTLVSLESKSDCKVSTFEKLLDAMGYDLDVLRKE